MRRTPRCAPVRYSVGDVDALFFAYVNPAWPPPGAFHPDKADLEPRIRIRARTSHQGVASAKIKAIALLLMPERALR